MTAYTEAFWARVMALVGTLDAISYYHMLGVDVGATREAIEDAYYRRARNIHPDGHGYERDPVRRQSLVRLYARFAEAFRVLRSPVLRAAYDEGLAAGRMRLSKEAEQDLSLIANGPDPRTPHALKLLETARVLAQSGNRTGALAQLRLAAQFEPASKAIQREIEACSVGEGEGEAG